MKKIFIILVALCCFIMPNVYAHEMLNNGWHIIPASDAKNSDSWNNQKKVWALYVNGVETKRYNVFYGVHRGYGDAPENSLASFKSVKKHGYYGFETDVRFTKDNVAVLCHDAYINNLALTKDLKPITGDKVYVKNLTYSQLKNNYIFNIQRLNEEPDKKLSNYNNNRITTFEEMLDYVKANNMQVSIELKEGTQEQIRSIVKMAEQKEMNNYVRWISFNVQLLEYVKNTDSDEKLGVLVNTAGKCDGDNNRYCTGDSTTKADSIYKRLKTNNNMVWFSSYTGKYNLPGTSFGKNMPIEKTKVDQEIAKNTLKTIPQAKINLNTNSINANANETKNITYNYNGDGTVKCISSNTKVVTCKVDSSNKKIIVNVKNDSTNSVDLNVYATQGIAYSATNDNKITVKINKQSEPVDTTIVKNISVAGYKLGFKENKHSYKLKIKNEKELNITCDLANNYKYKIVGNKNLKNGNIIYINIYKDKTKVSSYTITIEKEDDVSENTNISSETIDTSNENINNNDSDTNISSETIDSTNEISSSNESTSPRKYESSTTISTTPIEYETSTAIENTDNSNNTTTESPTEVTVVDVPDTYKEVNIIHYIIASIFFILAIYIIKKYRNNINKY